MAVYTLSPFIGPTLGMFRLNRPHFDYAYIGCVIGPLLSGYVIPVANGMSA
jgi:hypothetical protein